MRFTLTIVSLALLLPIVVVAASQPSPTKSEYLISIGAGFGLEKDKGAFYAMNFAVRKALPATVYVVALFDNPEGPEHPLKTEVTVQAEAKEIQVRSPPIHAITNGKRYNVRLMLYTDSDHTQLLSSHSQEVLFSVPKKLAAQFSEQYGISVR
jgi:hypothetical protein